MALRRLLQNALLLFFSVSLPVLAAEAVTRWVDGLPILTDWLPNTVERDVTTAQLDAISRAQGVSRDWFFIEPPPLPNRRPPPDEWVRLVREQGNRPVWEPGVLRPSELFKAWNSEFAKDPCGNPLLRQAPGRLFTYRSLDGGTMPRLRFLPNTTTPHGLVTNELGWRGPPVQVQRTPRTVRIVFVGASTTVNAHDFPFSYPELVGHWLNMWATSRGLDVRFEALNAGRESANSTDLEAVVRLEALPLRPELVVYYEGGNQFRLSTLVRTMPKDGPQVPQLAGQESGLALWLRQASNRSALARRLQSALGMVSNPGKGDEWAKPAYDLVWPAGLDERDPDLSRQDLPIFLPTILGDLDKMRASLASIGAELALSTFVRLVEDGMVLDPVRNRMLIEDLNIAYFPFRYADIARVSVFQNRVFAKYAARHGLPLLDVAARMPMAPDLFTDAVHLTYGGVRLHAWIVVQELIPLIEKRLASGAWPKPVVPAEPPPGLLFEPEVVTFDCRIAG